MIVNSPRNSTEILGIVWPICCVGHVAMFSGPIWGYFMVFHDTLQWMWPPSCGEAMIRTATASCPAGRANWPHNFTIYVSSRVHIVHVTICLWFAQVCATTTSHFKFRLDIPRIFREHQWTWEDFGRFGSMPMALMVSIPRIRIRKSLAHPMNFAINLHLSRWCFAASGCSELWDLAARAKNGDEFIGGISLWLYKTWQWLGLSLISMCFVRWFFSMGIFYGWNFMGISDGWNGLKWLNGDFDGNFGLVSWSFTGSPWSRLRGLIWGMFNGSIRIGTYWKILENIGKYWKLDEQDKVNYVNICTADVVSNLTWKSREFSLRVPEAAGWLRSTAVCPFMFGSPATSQPVGVMATNIQKKTCRRVLGTLRCRPCRLSS